MQKPDFNSPSFRRSRTAYCAQCAFEYFVSILVADAFLAKLLSSAGIDDSTVGIISSLVSVAFIMELAAIPLMRRIKHVKKTVIVFDVLSIGLLGCTYLLPFLNVGHGLRTLLAFICIGGGFALKYVVTSLYFAWANSFVHPRHRGSYSAIKEMVSLISGICVTLAAGFAMDRFEAEGRLSDSFMMIAGVIAALDLISFICLMLISREQPGTFAGEAKPLKEVLRAIFGNRQFVGVIVMTSLWNAARYMSIGFMGTYKTQELLFTVGAVQVINVCGCLARFCVSIPFGRLSDRTGYANGFCVSLFVLAAAFACACFTGPSTRWLLVGYSLLLEMSYAGSGQNSYNMAYTYMDKDYIVQALSVKDCISGVVGFLFSLIGSRILALIQAGGNTFLGLHIYGQQVLCALSLMLCGAAIIYVKHTFRKKT